MKKYTFVVLCFTVFLLSCSNMKKMSNRLDSDDYATPSERVAILKKEINAFSDFSDAEFELFNVNGFSNSRVVVPGASSWDYKFALIIQPSEIGKWTEGMIQTVEPGSDSNNWMKAIVAQRKENWPTSSTPTYYTRENQNVIMVVFEAEGIIFKRVRTE